MSSVASVGPDLHAQGESYPSKSWKEAPWIDGVPQTCAKPPSTNNSVPVT